MNWNGLELPPAYYQDESVYIIHGDCREVLPLIPDKSIDLVLTSPPYNKRGTSGWLVGAVEYSDDIPEDDYQKWQVEILNLCYGVLNDSGSLFYNHKIRYDYGAIFPVTWLARTLFTIWQEIIWNRKITGNIRGWRFWNIDERLYWLVKQKPQELEQEFAQYNSIWEIRPENGITAHPAPFPLEIPTRCILALTSRKDIILDPFSGSGTTLRASKDLNRKCIGIEIEEKYCEIAVKRCSQSVMKLDI